MSFDDFPPRRVATISIRPPCPGEFCSLFLRHLFPRTPRASPITCLFSDCIHLAAADARRMSRTKISSRLPGWKVWRMTKGRASHGDPSSLPFELRFSGPPLSPNPCRSAELRAEWTGRNHVGDLARSRQGRTLSSRVSERTASISREMLISLPARSPAPLASCCPVATVTLLGTSTL